MLDDFARVDHGAVDRAAEHLGKLDHPVALIQEQHSNDLVLPVRELHAQEVPGILGRNDRLADDPLAEYVGGRIEHFRFVCRTVVLRAFIAYKERGHVGPPLGATCGMS